MDNERIEKLVKTLPCASSDCGMYEGKAKEAITELLKEERIKVIDECVSEIERLNDLGVLYEHTARRVLEALKGKQQ